MTYIGSTINTLANRLQQHLEDKNSVVYKNKQYDPKIELLCDYPCYSKHDLEAVENYYINKLYSGDMLNKRGLIKKKKDISWKCDIINSQNICSKFIEKFKIKEKQDSFVIEYRNGDKRVFIRKKFNNTNKTEVLKQMEISQKKLINDFIQSEFGCE
jgi:hypothetical protein